MASVFARGTKSAPRFYARFKAADGKWKAQRVRQETRREALRIAQSIEAKCERQRFGLEPSETSNASMRDLLKRWENSLTNRAAYDDRCRLRKWIVPRWGAMRIGDVTLKAIMLWIDDARATAQPSAPTLRHCLTILSRFFGWCIVNEHATTNPLRSLPSNKRPAQAAKADTPWISDDATVRALMAALPEPFGLMFYVGNRAGLRTGEICGLRLSDVDELAAGAIRVRFSYNGPLKEDRRAAGKSKWAPAPADAVEVLGPWLAKRLREGAGPEEYLFPREGRHYRKEHLEYAWRKAAPSAGVTATWYQATRHSFASRSLSAGAPLDEVAAALGHSTPAITARHYAHFVRKHFSPLLTAGLDPRGAPDGGKVLPIEGARAALSLSRPSSAAAGAVDLREGTEDEDAA